MKCYHNKSPKINEKSFSFKRNRYHIVAKVVLALMRKKKTNEHTTHCRKTFDNNSATNFKMRVNGFLVMITQSELSGIAAI